MYRIVEKKELAPSVKLMKVEAPEVARKVAAGQFIILRTDEMGERIPLTVADYDREAGTITIIFQEVGYSTEQLGAFEEGDSLLDFVGPLGKPTEIENYGTVLCVGGGVGVAPVLPIAKALKEAGNRVISIIGARCDELLILEEEMREASTELYITTDDGSCSLGIKGFVTDQMKAILEDPSYNVSHIWAIGPVIMMKFCAQLTKNYNVPTTVSMNPIMVDGTGMCGACRVSVGDETKFACVDGPEFDGHKIDWDLAMRRMNIYRAKEAAVWEQRKGGQL